MIYLFDENEKLFKILKKESLKSADQTYNLTTENYVSDRLAVETKGMNAGEVERAHFMAIQSLEDRHKFHYFFIARKETDKTTILEGVQSGIEELRKTPVYDKRPRGLSARNVIEDLLRGTNWVPRFIADAGLKNTNLYYTSVFEALKKVCKVWGLEMQFFVEMNGNQIGARFIDFKKKIGEATGKRVVYGHNALKILSESESTNLFTALIGRGKGEQVSSAEENESGQAGYGRKINFEEIVWSKSKGNPVDKPAGQKYVEIPEMTQKYGILNADGTRRPKIGFIDFGDEEDREALLQQTYEALKDSSRPQLTLKTSSVYLKNVAIGDTIRVVRHDRKLDYETRVFEITVNRLNNKSTDIKLGDRTSQSNEAKIQSVADKAVEEFVEGNFNDFIKNIPDFLPSADGFNQNWYSEENPIVTHPKKVMIGDIWYKPDPEHEGHKIMLRWTGEMWEEILRTYNAERLKEQIEAEMAEVDGRMKVLDDELKSKVAELLAKAGVAESAADDAKWLAEQAILNINDVQERSNSAIQDALTEARRLDQEERKATERAIQAARTGAIAEATNLVNVAKRALETDLSAANRLILETKRTLENQVSGVSTELTKTNDTIRTFAKKTDVDRVNQRLSTAETSITQQANQIALKANQQTVDTLSGRVRNAESSITQQGEQIALKANKSDVDSVKNRVSQAEASLQVQAGQIAAKANKTDVDNLSGKVSQAEATLRVQAGEIASRVKTADFDKEKEKLRTAETNIRQLGDRITTEISRTEAKVDNLKVGSRNYAEDYDFSRGLWEYSQGDSSQTTRGVSDGVFTMATTAATWHQWQIHSESGSRLGGKLDSTALLELETGETYTLSVEVKANSGSPDFWFELRDNGKVNYNNVVTHFGGSNKSIKATSNWTRYSVTGVLKPNSDFSHRRIILGYNAIGSVSFRKVELTKSSIFTDAGPAPEDISSEIEAVKTTITQTAEGVQQLSTRVTQAEDKSSRQETQINQLIGDVSSKVSQTDYDNLKRTVDGHTTEMRQTKESINLKADKTLVTTVQTTATEAKNLANSANSKSDSATAKANQADSKATSANAKAEQASTKADSAVSTANQANQKATSADSKASNAATKAEDAARKSAEAMTKSVDALSKAGLVDAKAAEALTKAIQNSQSISRAQAELQVANEAIQQKVSKVDFDLANRKLATAETQINTIAGQISTKLSRTEVVQTIESKGYQTAAQVDSKITSKGYQTAGQVDSLVQAKGYQTAGQVEAAITSKGYVTTSTFSNTIQQTERGLVSRIAQVETKIPDGYSGANLILEGARQQSGQHWGNTTLTKHDYYHNGEKYHFQLNTDQSGEITSSSNRFKVKRNTKYTLSFWTYSSGNMTSFDVYFLGRKKGETRSFTSIIQPIRNHANSPHRAEYVTVTFASGENDEGYIRFDNNGSNNGKIAIFGFAEVMLVEGNTPARYSPSPDELATTTALHEVRDTVDAHTRTLTTQGRSISQVTQTAEGIVSRVANTESTLTRLDGRANFVESALNSTKTEVSQLAGSWAVRNLTSSGTVLNQLNLNKDGSVKIDGKLVQITGQTYIQDGVISSAKIGNLDAGKITTGTLNAARVSLINLDASKITSGSMEARFIRGGQLTSLNGATMFDLQSGTLNFQQNSPSIRRLQNGYGNQFLKFETGGFTFDGRRGYNTNKTLLGSTRSGVEDAESGDFTGLRIWNGQAGGQAADMIDIIADKVVFQDAANASSRSPWILETVTGTGDLHFYGNAENGKRHHLGIGSRKFQTGHFVHGYFDELYLIGAGGYIRVAQMLKDLALKMGYTGNDGWANRIG